MYVVFNRQKNVLADVSVLEMLTEIRSRWDVVAVQVWLRQDLKDALESDGYASDDDAVDEVLLDARDALEDCSDGWDRLAAVIADHRDELRTINN